MSKPSDQIETIVDAALDLPLADRAAYLDQACGGDASLRQSVEALLRAHRHVPSPPAATIKISADVASEAPGDRIGPYKLLQQLGEGGCGVVYMAEQEEPVRRRVALKVIKPGMDTKQVIARFEAERQALALMDHPNIAKVLDAGASETGRPYFVMELVRGVKITDYCDQNNLPTQQRLELFIQVCKAVQHAHQKGIIHRDLKPSNILVTLHDGVPVPKVIDFGIAKATEQRLTDKTLFTALQQFIGTPAYMSPEQAEMSGLDIDTRSDIYSLGVLLYELLTSRIPFDPRELVAAGLDAMRKIIRENEPVRPSTKLNTLTAAEQSTVAKQRQVEAPKLVQLVRGDLDWIVMKCLEKDRTRRYETANGLAMDIRRHLENEPVVACPPSAAYRLQKLVRRNKPAVAAVGAVVTALVIGLGISAWQYVEKSKAYTRAVAAEKLADGNARAEERQRRLAEENAGKAQQAAKLEAEQRVRAEQLAEENRLALYTANIRVAERMVKEGDVNNAAALLDSLRPNVNQSDLRGFEWYFLWRQLRAELFSIKHPNRVLSCAFSSDGNILATAGERGVIRLSNPTNGVELARLTGNSNWVTMLTFSSDSRTLAACGEDGRICIWSLHEPGSPKTLQVTNESFGALAFSADGNYLAAGEAFAGNWVGNPFTIFAPRGSPGRVYVWDAQTFKLLWSSESQTHGVRSLTFSKNGKRLASAGLGDSVKLHDALTGRVVAIQTNFPGPVFVISHLANDNEIAAGSWFPYHDSGEIKILDAATLEIKRTLVERAGKVLTLASSPDGSKLVSGGADGQTRLWDTDSGTELATFAGSDDGGSGAYVSSVGFSPDGERLAASTWDGVARVWNIQDGGPVQRIRTSNSFSVAFSPDSSLLASAGRSVEIRNPKTGRLLHVLPGYSSTDIRLAFAPDGSVLAAIDFDSRLNFWDVKTWRRWTPEAEELDPTTPTPAHFEPDTQFAFSPDSQTLAMCGHDKLIRFWSVKTGRLLNTITNGIRADSLAFTPDGRKLISGSLNDTSFWDIYNNQREFTLGGQGSLARISQDGRWLAHGGGSIQLRDLTSMRATFLLRGHSMQTYGIAFSHDSRDLATAS